MNAAGALSLANRRINNKASDQTCWSGFKITGRLLFAGDLEWETTETDKKMQDNSL